ncbi:hypothetical protein ACF0H5_022900 [Mactra antiquata]
MKAPKWWIGLADDDVEGTYVWYGTNDKPTFTDWSPGNPSDSGSNEDCGEFDKNGGNGLQWNDVNCHALRPVICESVQMFGDFDLPENFCHCQKS